jgi:hypothetical protein
VQGYILREYPEFATIRVPVAAVAGRNRGSVMFSLRTHVWIFLGLLAATVLLGIAGNLLAAPKASSRC